MASHIEVQLCGMIPAPDDPGSETLADSFNAEPMSYDVLVKQYKGDCMDVIEEFENLNYEEASERAGQCLKKYPNAGFEEI